MIENIEVLWRKDPNPGVDIQDPTEAVLHFQFKDGRQIQVYVRENGLCVSAVCGGRLVIEPGANNTMQVSAVLP